MKQIIIIFSLLASFSVFAEYQLPEPEVILGLVYDSTGVTFQVESDGCTDKSYFVILQLKTSPVQIVLGRVRLDDEPDDCIAYTPYGTFVKFTYEELGQKAGDKFDIGNRFKKRLPVF